MNIYQLNKYVTCILMYKHNRWYVTKYILIHADASIPQLIKQHDNEFSQLFFSHIPFVTYYNIVMGRSPASKGSLTETLYRLYVDFGR